MTKMFFKMSRIKYVKSVFILILVFNLSFPQLMAQDHELRLESIDILNYKFNLTLSDDSNEIQGIAEVKIKFKKPLTEFNLDLVEKQLDNNGMSVSSILEENNQIAFTQGNHKLKFDIDLTKSDDIRTYKITYHGIPSDGLIISKNKYGDRTFFGDNWPDRAKNWIPVVDHPSEKATVEWVIIAPSHYQSIGNGLLIEKTNLKDKKILTRWKTNTPIPSKIMVIGVAQFAVEYLEEVNNIPVSSWVFPQDRNNGFKDYAAAIPVLKFMMEHVGAYPFRKLANVQSKTLYGGMENAGNIFYNENYISGKGDYEDTIAHEVAHQWFGDSASELNWYHVWLSEGFATYFENLFFENNYGRDSFVKKMKADRQKALRFSKLSQAPIVDTSVTDYLKLLNPNSYQKGSWVLHMLRKELGDDLFWQGIRAYYEKYKFGNALSEDFERVIETVSGKDFSTFFKQWLYQSGHPKLEVKWEFKDVLILEIKQTQDYLFTFPIDIKINFEDGSSSIITKTVLEQTLKTILPMIKNVSSIELDPNTWLFFEKISIIKKN